MSLTKALNHNQSLIIAALISILSTTGIIACHLTDIQKHAIITTAAETAQSAATGSPLPWSQIGLAIGTILGSGAVVDNRRKDVLIKRLKKENDNHLGIFTTLVKSNGANTSRVPPISNN